MNTGGIQVIVGYNLLLRFFLPETRPQATQAVHKLLILLLRPSKHWALISHNAWSKFFLDSQG